MLGSLGSGISSEKNLTGTPHLPAEYWARNFGMYVYGECNRLELGISHPFEGYIEAVRSVGICLDIGVRGLINSELIWVSETEVTKITRTKEEKHCLLNCVDGVIKLGSDPLDGSDPNSVVIILTNDGRWHKITKRIMFDA